MDVRAYYRLSYGVFVICSKKDDKYNGQIGNVLFQVTSQPATVAISINKNNLTHSYISDSKVFSASILGTTTPLPFIGSFGFRSGRDANKFENVKYKVGKTGAPIVTDNAVAFIEANVINQLDVGTHTIFIGEVVEAEILDEKGEAMTYSYYQQVKRGTTPKAAPTYVAPAVQEAKPA